MHNLKNNILMIKRGILILLKIEKTYMLLHIVTSIISPLIPYINIYMMAKIVDQLAGPKDVKILTTYVLITLILNMITTLLLAGLNHLKKYHLSQFYKNEKMFFAEKIMTMDYENIENRDVNLLFERVKIESQTGYNAYYLYTFFGQMISSATNIIVPMFLTFNLFIDGSILLISKFIMLGLITLAIFINFYSSKRSNKLTLDMYGKFVPFNALFNFYGNYFSDYNAGKDIRLYNMEEYVASEQRKQDLLTANIYISTKKKTLKYIFLNSFSTDTLNIAVYIFVMLACVAGSVSIGSIAKYISCIALFIGAINGIIYQMQSLFNNNKYLVNYFSFLDIPAKMYQGTLPVEKQNDNKHEIEFHDVSFKYPGAQNYALKNLTLKIRTGQRMAVVGMNGSGKTTMIKLLCRLYDPTEGEITLNGINIKEYDYNEYMSIFSVVFQDFKLFSFDLGQNVATKMDYDSKKVTEALNKAGLSERVSSMPKGLETPLYKDFEEDGVEISGGEAQKIALARALYKNTPFIVLDEPTAAFDPIAEFEIYSKFNEIIGDKTAIYISHRLSSCRFCNDIAVFHEGELIQRGSHDTLIADTTGKYHELWNAQAQHYT